VSTLQTIYLGLTLRSPIVASAGPVTRDLDDAVRLEEAGAGAIVLPSLFEEEILNEELGLNRALEAGAGADAEAQSYFPRIEAFDTTADRYIASVSAAKSHLTIPVIASLNAATPGGWVRYARSLEDASRSAAIETSLSATCRASRVSSARNTIAMPPWPISRTIRYVPMSRNTVVIGVPVCRALRARERKGR
jgi:dihydroorotate dehydrogenase (fumarate)